jgi:hypothetical protein
MTKNALKSTSHADTDAFVRKSLGMDDGLYAYVDGGSLYDCLLDGSDFEDGWTRGGLPRGFNHFHNPTKPVAYAGLTDVARGLSAVEWAKPCAGNEWDYGDFKEFYRLAVTAERPEERLVNTKKMFVAAGHLMHLVQDMLVPAHTRNDLIGGHIGVVNSNRWIYGSPIEVFLNRNRGFVKPVPTTLIPTFSTLEEFFDTGAYRSTGSYPIGGLGIGAAEYTNANFFSEHTVFSCDPRYAEPKKAFPHPCYADVYGWSEGGSDWPIIGALTEKRYVGTRTGQPDTTIRHLARATYFDYEWIEQSNHSFFRLDEACYADYLDKLVPKAVGYSAGLMVWLTRGEIDFTLNATAGTMTFTNRSQQRMDGSFTLHYDKQGAVREAVPEAQWFVILEPGASFVTPSFSLPGDIGMEGTLVLLFEGYLGSEKGAVVAATKKLGPYVFGSTQSAQYGELLYPFIEDRFTTPDPDGTIYRIHNFYVGLGSKLSAGTIWRSTDIRISLKVTPALRKKFGLDEGQKVLYVNVNTYNNPGVVEYFKIGLPNGKWKYIYDGKMNHADEGWGGVSNPLEYIDGLWKPETGYIPYYMMFPTWTNYGGECSLSVHDGGPPGVLLQFSYPYDASVWAAVPNCPNVDALIQQADLLYPTIVDFYWDSLDMARDYADVIRDGNWRLYGFEVKVNRLVVYPVHKGDGLLLDAPFVFHKDFGSDLVTVH